MKPDHTRVVNYTDCTVLVSYGKRFVCSFVWRLGSRIWTEVYTGFTYDGTQTDSGLKIGCLGLGLELH